MDTTTEHGGGETFDNADAGRAGEEIEGLSPVEEIQTVPFDNPLSDEQTHPVFRVSITLGDDTFAVDFDHRQAAENWRSAIAALSHPAQPAAPDPSADGGGGGEVDVRIPREPTEAMMDAGNYASSHDSTSSDVETMWKAMFDAVTLDGGCTEAVLASRTPALGAAGVAGEMSLRLSWATDALRVLSEISTGEAQAMAQAGLDLATADEDALCAAGNDDALASLASAREAAPAPQPQGPAPDGGVKALREALDSFPQGLVLDFDPKRPNMFWRRNGTSFTSDGKVERAVRDWAARVFRALAASAVDDADGDAGGEVGS